MSRKWFEAFSFAITDLSSLWLNFTGIITYAPLTEGKLLPWLGFQSPAAWRSFVDQLEGSEITWQVTRIQQPLSLPFSTLYLLTG